MEQSIFYKNEQQIFLFYKLHKFSGFCLDFWIFSKLFGICLYMLLCWWLWGLLPFHIAGSSVTWFHLISMICHFLTPWSSLELEVALIGHLDLFVICHKDFIELLLLIQLKFESRRVWMSARNTVFIINYCFIQTHVKLIISDCWIWYFTSFKFSLSHLI